MSKTKTVSDKTGKELKGIRNTKTRYTVLVDEDLKERLKWLRVRTGEPAHSIAQRAFEELIERYEKKNGTLTDPHRAAKQMKKTIEQLKKEGYNVIISKSQ